MWKITNEKNKKTLKNFERKVVIPLFKLLLDACNMNAEGKYNINSSEDIWKTTTTYKKFPSDQKKIIDYVFRIRKKTNFYDVFFEIVKEYDKEMVLDVIHQYRIENYEININKNYNVTYNPIPGEFHTIFVTFFYERYFELKKIWKMVDGINVYDRSLFHNNFYKENKIKVCPYCDMSAPLAKASNYIEHFLPKEKFPLLAMNPYNLISSCDACNSPDDGKGTKIKQNIITPYNDQIGKYLDFSLRKTGIKISNSKSLTEVDNFLDLLNLEKRYKQEKVIDFVRDEVKIQLDILITRKYKEGIPTKKEIETYLLSKDKHSLLNTALTSIVKKHPIYISAK
ncbi:hypothetical protein [Bacillus cereus]|uniref:hypothetical protein n=1 Tax=Bacillus cereus TaxID=1396 RepID=UPI003CFC7232